MSKNRIEIQIIRSRRRSISLEINKNNRVILRVPMEMKDEEIRQFLKEKEFWLRKHLRRDNSRSGEASYVRFTLEEMQEMKEAAKKIFPGKVQYYAEQLGVTYGKITIRNQKTRWGSCSSKGNLNFNCLLVQAPEYVLDYVVVHELCHRIHMNHSRAFWMEVEKILPDYRAAELWLKKNGRILIQRMTGE